MNTDRKSQTIVNDGDLETAQRHSSPLPPICGRRFKYICDQKGWTDKRLTLAANISRNTLGKIRKDTPVAERVIERFCAVTGIPRTDIEIQPEPPPESEWVLPTPRAWELVQHLTAPMQIDNGLVIRFSKLKHIHTENRFGRGKLYELFHLDVNDRPKFHDHLMRHANVCNLVRNKRGLAQNYEVTPLGKQSGWWVIDHWIEGQSLSDIVSDGGEEWSLSRVAWLGSEILKALGELHAVGVVMRELTPERIYIEPSQVTLTDFELAKLVKGTISVRGGWTLTNPYRAPEISRGDPHPSSDLYSWARIMCFVLTGTPTPKTIPKLADYPQIETLIRRCHHSSAGRRPESTNEILQAWHAWQPS